MTAIESSYRPADWRPLERALAAEFGTAAIDASAAFWFIGYVAGPDDVGEIRLYEHSTTRRRLALDCEGSAYRWLGDAARFCPIAIGDALVQALV